MNDLGIDLKSLAHALGGKTSNGQVLAPGPGHSSADRSLSVKLDSSAPDGFVVHSFCGNDPIECRDYVRQKLGLPAFKPNGRGHAGSTVAQPHIDKPKGRLVATYDYTDAAGELLYQVLRYEPKDFRQRQPDVFGDGWIWKRGDRQVLYRWPELLKFPDATVFICEGEKDADRVASLGHCATTLAGGSIWTEECVKALAGRDCIILQDNDGKGRERSAAAAQALHGTAKSLRIVALPNLPDKGDVSDWLDTDPRRAETLADVCLNVPIWTPLKSVDDRPAGNNDTAPLVRLQSKSEFIGGYVAPDWLIDGILQRRYVYSLTARTGDGKTAVAQLITKLVSMPNRGSTFLGRHAVDHGNTVYFAGENPDDLRMRIIADDAKEGRKGATDNCSFIVGTFEIPAMFAECKAKAATMPGGKIDLVIVDTSAAYFLGEEENSNAQMGNHARTLRTLTELPGQPCVLVLCHPVKNAADQTQLLPRGGGAFIAEMDGNLTLWRTDEVTELWHTGKLRGPGFEPMTFRLEKITCDALVDKKGRHIPTVRAVAISESDKDDLARTTRSNEDRLLAAMLEPGRSVEALASACGWTSSTGEAQKSKAHRIIKSLEKSGLVRLHRGTYELTEKGRPAAAAAGTAAARTAAA
jgi:AAA domain